MKIGIVTLAQGNDNYGGALQAYALQTVLSQMGHESFFVNTELSRRPQKYSRFIEHPIREIQRYRRYRSFLPFWRENFNMDPKGCRSVADCLSDPSVADALICGSDQIWARGLRNDPLERRLSFLDFKCNRDIRIAYAASWGSVELEEYNLPCISSLLNRFTAVGVREDSGVVLAGRCGAEAKWVVDPTLLLDAGFWSSFAEKSTRMCPGNTLLFSGYRWKSKLSPKKAVNLLRKKRGLGLAVPCYEKYFTFLGSNVVLNPCDWVRYIRDAEFVLTNSFHCMVFSIIFHKPFAVLSLGGHYEGMNTRVESLGARLGLRNRIVNTESELAAIENLSIDWGRVDSALNEWISESSRFLRNCLCCREGRREKGV